jgi:anthranilate/para-aminobenzoate synthase component I
LVGTTTEIVYLDSNDHHDAYCQYDCVLAVDAFTSLQTDYLNAFEDLKQYKQNAKDWLFGYLSYDLKNDVEALHSNNFDGLGFPDLFFQPKKIFLLQGKTLEMQYLALCDDEIDGDFEAILGCERFSRESDAQKLAVQQRISKENYLAKVGDAGAHPSRGYLRSQFLHGVFAENASIDPIQKFENSMPFPDRHLPSFSKTTSISCCRLRPSATFKNRVSGSFRSPSKVLRRVLLMLIKIPSLSSSSHQTQKSVQKTS